MKTTPISLVTACLLVFVFAESARAEQTMSDDEALALISSRFTNSCLPVPLGGWEVLRDDLATRGVITLNAEKRQLGPAYFLQVVLPAQKIGLVEIRQDSASKTLQSGNSVDWDTLLKEGQGAVAAKIQVVPTKKGKELAAASNLPVRQGYLIVRDADFSITKIIKKDEVKTATDVYCVVFFTYDAKWTPWGKEFYSAQGSPVEEKRKGKMLFKYDLFTSKWKHVTADYSNLESEFATDYVDARLKDLLDDSKSSKVSATTGAAGSSSEQRTPAIVKDRNDRYVTSDGIEVIRVSAANTDASFLDGRIMQSKPAAYELDDVDQEVIKRASSLLVEKMQKGEDATWCTVDGLMVKQISGLSCHLVRDTPTDADRLNGVERHHYVEFKVTAFRQRQLPGPLGGRLEPWPNWLPWPKELIFAVADVKRIKAEWKIAWPFGFDPANLRKPKQAEMK